MQIIEDAECLDGQPGVAGVDESRHIPVVENCMINIVQEVELVVRHVETQGIYIVDKYDHPVPLFLCFGYHGQNIVRGILQEYRSTIRHPSLAYKF